LPASGVRVRKQSAHQRAGNKQRNGERAFVNQQSSVAPARLQSR